jgi:1-deoxy-D-xylulose-5-phosphate reductoisomerase
VVVRGVTVLGATGSIGKSTLDVLSRHPERYAVVALSANKDVAGMLALCRVYRPKIVAMSDESAARDLYAQLQQAGLKIEVLSGVDGLAQIASLAEVDTVMAAIVGAAGLLPTLAAAKAGKRVLLANKEALVMSGRIFMDAVKDAGAVLLPVDSEHNAIFQCMASGFDKGLSTIGVTRILLTASGGPFRTKSLDMLRDVTPEQACAHPNWVMGRKISVDSATMMNKGLEVIEACWLFNTSADNVQVVVHPQSVVHSMVEYVDGSILAQLGSPDMRTPIAHALAWPERVESGVERLNLFDVARFDFESPDMERFPCLRLAYEAVNAGGTATAILNAANEVAVDAFLSGRLPFTAISGVIEKTLDKVTAMDASSLDIVLEADRQARVCATDSINTLKVD